LIVKVTTYDDMPVPGATITISTNNTTVSGITDESGAFKFNLTEKGIVENEMMTITSEHLGYTIEVSVPSATAGIPGFEAASASIGILAALLIIRRFKS